MWKPIRIYKLSIGTDDVGNCNTTKELMHHCKAEINCIGGKEYYEARKINAENEVTFKIRWCKALKDLTPQDYMIEFDSVCYDIRHIDNYLMSNEFLKIKAVERNGTGDIH